jgi:hypothetical protein
MNFKFWLNTLWKLPVCELAFFAGFMLGGRLAIWLGIPAPELPAGAETTLVLQYTLVGSLLLIMTLAAVSLGLSGGFVSRWLSLFLLAWVAYSVNNALEAAIFSTMAAASLFAVVVYLPAFLACCAALAWLFQPAAKGAGFAASLREFLASRDARSWAWRLVAAFAAFPIIYYCFGSIIAPWVVDYYRQGVAELALPGWDRLLPVLFLRSLFFLLACLPVLIAWRHSNRRLVLALGAALFMLVGGFGLLVAYWFPPVLRLVHSLEILADELVYAAALAILLARPKPVLSQPQVGIRPQVLAGGRRPG